MCYDPALPPGERLVALPDTPASRGKTKLDALKGTVTSEAEKNRVKAVSTALDSQSQSG